MGKFPVETLVGVRLGFATQLVPRLSVAFETISTTQWLISFDVDSILDGSRKLTLDSEKL